MFFASFSTVKAQSIYGKISDQRKQPLPKVLILIEEASKSTTSDSLGYFKIKNIGKGQYTVFIQSLGYKSQKKHIELTSDYKLNITLQDSMFSLIEVHIETDRYDDKEAHNSHSIEIVDEEKILENPNGNLMSTLQEVAGVNSINTGVGIGKPVIRGLSQNRVLVVESGIKQEGQQWGNDHGLEIDQFDVEEVEIIKGASSLEYGSDALGGVLIIPRATHLPIGEFQHSARGIYKSNNELYGIMARSKGNHKGLTYRLNISNLSYGDYTVPAEEFNYNKYILPIYNGELKNTAGKELHYSMSVGGHIKSTYVEFKMSKFNQEAGFFPGAVGIPRAYNLQSDNDSRNIDLPYQHVQHDKYYMFNSFYGKNGSSIQLDLGIQRNVRREYSAPHAHGRPSDFSTDLAHELILTTYSANIKYSNDEKKKFRKSIGIQTSYLNNEIGGYEFIIPPYNQINSGLYSLLEYKVNDKLRLNGGLRFDFSDFNIAQSSLDFYSRGDYKGTISRNDAIKEQYYNVSGAFGLVKNLSTKWKSRLNIGKSFRIPSVVELSSNGVHHGAFRYEKGDPTLSPESGYQLDLSLEFENNKFDMEFSPFINYFENYLFLSPTGNFPTITINDTLYVFPGSGQVYQYKESAVGHFGGEIKSGYKINEHFYASILGEYVWIQNLVTKIPISFTPPPSATLNINYATSFSKYSKLKLGASYKAFAAQNRVDQNEKTTPAYELVSATVGFIFTRKNTISVNFSIQNLFNKKYLNHLSRYRPLNIPEQGRNFVVSLNYVIN